VGPTTFVNVPSVNFELDYDVRSIVNHQIALRRGTLYGTCNCISLASQRFFLSMLSIWPCHPWLSTGSEVLSGFYPRILHLLLVSGDAFLLQYEGKDKRLTIFEHSLGTEDQRVCFERCMMAGIPTVLIGENKRIRKSRQKAETKLQKMTTKC
jgi:hypothetical protein